MFGVGYVVEDHGPFFAPRRCNDVPLRCIARGAFHVSCTIWACVCAKKRVTMRVDRPWGSFEVIAKNEESEISFLVKRIVVKPLQRLSLQSHTHRAEHWVVICGEGTAAIGENTVTLGVNSHLFIPIGVKHRLSNTHETIPLVMVEVQVGKVLEESDIVRYEDDYLRA